MGEYFSLLLVREWSDRRQYEGTSKHIGNILASHLEDEFPLARHVEHQAVGAPAARAQPGDRGRVVHAVAMLRHVRVDLQALGLGISGLGAGGDLNAEVLADFE